MKITKRQLRRLIKEEMHDCIKDYMLMGYSRTQAYEKCGADDERSSYSSYSRPRYQRRTSYVGSDANAEQIEAVEASLAIRSNNFLTSVLKQLKNGRGLSGKQKSIVKKIIGKQDPEAASLFESPTKQSLRRIIRETMEDFKPRYKGDTPAKQGADKYVSDRRRKQTPPVNMDFQRNVPGYPEGDESSSEVEDFTWEEEADQYTTYGEDDPDHVGYKGNPWALEEKDGSTEKYDDDSALKGDQSKLPDGLQKGIIDKTVEDREEREKEEQEKKNEGVAINNMPAAWQQILGNCLEEK